MCINLIVFYETNGFLTFEREQWLPSLFILREKQLYQLLYTGKQFLLYCQILYNPQLCLCGTVY